MPKVTPVRALSLTQARRLWHRRLHLAAPAPDLDTATRRGGDARTLGGVDAYLALSARAPGLKRTEIDAALAARTIRITPAARGCIYLVPGDEAPLMMRFAEALYRKTNDRLFKKVDVTHDELATTGQAALTALADGAKTTAQLRAGLPEGAYRSLGAPGKKVGLSSTLPPALRLLEFAGKIVRQPVGDALDTERYTWSVPDADPFEAADLPGDAAGVLAAVAARFFRHAAPATRDDLAAWTGAGKRDCAKAIAAASLVPVSVDGYAEVAWLPEADLEVVDDLPPSERVSLLPSQDALMNVRPAMKWFVDPDHWEAPVRSWGAGPGSTLGAARFIQSRALFVGDELAGLWEYDPATRKIAWSTLSAPPPARRAAIVAEVERVQAFINDELGHAQAFSLDTDAKLTARATALETWGHQP